MAITYWKDIDMFLNRKINGDILEMTNEDAISNSLTNIFETMQGSRRMLPSFASPIYNLLFEPIDEDVGSILGEYILSAVQNWEPRIVIDRVNINVNYDNNYYEISLQYHTVSSNITSSLTFNTILQAR